MACNAKSFTFAVLALLAMVATPSFASDVAPRYIVDAGRVHGNGEWRPTKTQVAQAEQGLRDFLKTDDESHLKWHIPGPAGARGAIGAMIDTYTLQFVGGRQNGDKQFIDFKNAEGAKVIYIAGFCSESPLRDLDKHLNFVADGGRCYFQAMYDPALNAIIYFSVNGYA